MGIKDFDPEDIVAAAATFVGASSMAGIATWDLFDVSLSDSVFALAGNDITLATVIVAASLLSIIVTNDNASLSTLHEDARELDDVYYYSVLASVGLLVGWVFVPDVSSFVTGSDLTAVAYVLVSMVAHAAIGWLL